MKAIDLFSGSGGLALGLKQAGFEIAVNVEINRDTMETYCTHDNNAVHINKDIRAVSFESYRGTIDLIVGGPPCQPFSIGGLRKASSDSRDMIPEYIRCLQECQPEAFIMENVPGLLLKKTRQYFNSIIYQLANCGYLLNWAVVNAADYGVPQKRKRLIILGSRTMQLKFPVPTHGPSLLIPHVTTFSVIGTEAIGEAPNCPVKFARFPDLRPSPYAGHLYNGGGRPIDPNSPCHTILASAGGYKTHWFDTQNIAPEYHAHLKREGQPWGGEVPGARRMSVEESALIQTFPKGMVFSGKRSSQYTQVGDAVPPKLAYVIAQAIRDQLNAVCDQTSLAEPLVENTFVQGELAL